jgi:Ca2+/Na+ antiporter
LQDLVTNAATALKGYPEAAMMGCFCAPMFNILIGLGVPLAVVRIKKGSGAFLGAPTWPVRITFFAVLCTLVCLTIMAATNRFTRLTRTHGVILVIMWVVVSFMIVLAALFDAEEDGTL